MASLSMAPDFAVTLFDGDDTASSLHKLRNNKALVLDFCASRGVRWWRARRSGARARGGDWRAAFA